MNIPSVLMVNPYLSNKNCIIYATGFIFITIYNVFVSNSVNNYLKWFGYIHYMSYFTTTIIFVTYFLLIKLFNSYLYKFYNRVGFMYHVN